MNRDFSVKEVLKIVRRLKNCKARGWDSIPNEAIKNAPGDFFILLTRLYNMIKRTGKMPEGWNRGLVTLVHKKGKRDLLSNYRPLTVIISLCGLYSKILNERLSEVVEHHKLLGEIQNGFRKGRGSVDNSFILDTILWKLRSKGQQVHMGFVDLHKELSLV